MVTIWRRQQTRMARRSRLTTHHGRIAAFAREFSNFRAPIPAQMSQIDQAANGLMISCMYNINPSRSRICWRILKSISRLWL